MKKAKVQKKAQPPKAFIVFGATGGIGRAIVKALHDAGHNVIAVARTEHALEQLTFKYMRKGRVRYYVGNALSVSDVEKAFDRTVEFFGTVDGVINATGSWKMLDFDTSIGDGVALTEQMLKMHVLPVQIIGRVAREFFLGEKKKGLVVNISSHAGFRPELPGNLAYGPAKAAARFAMMQLDTQLRKKTGIRFCDIAPAIVNTPEAAEFLDTPRKRRLAVQPETIASFIVKNIDNPRIPTTKNFRSRIDV